MKKIMISSMLMVASVATFAQVPVTSGLQMHLDAASGFNPNGPAAATWTDLSPGGTNSVAAPSNALEPTLVTNVMGTGFDGVSFNGSSNYMVNTLNSTMSNTEGTIFVVRISENHETQNGGSGYNSLVSVAEDQGSWINEMGLGADWAMHHSSSGNWKHLRHQCYTSLPTDRPVIISGVYGIDEADIDFVVNDIHSTQTIFTQSAPWDYSIVDRAIAVGARYQGSPVSTTFADYYDGYMFEVLVYDRKLSASEQHDVNVYLKCKYNIDYSAALCNDPDYACDPCFQSHNLSVVQTGYNDKGECEFKATVTGVPAAGGTILGYEWSIPGMGSFVVTTSATSDVQLFTMPVGGGLVTVKIFAVKGTWEPGESPCCEWEDQVQIECKEQGDNGGQKQANGISDKGNKGISIYPNPTDRFVNINNTTGNPYRISVTDFTGKTIINSESVDKKDLRLSLEGKPGGVYMIQIADNNGKTIKTEKLILK
jgi:hypothetical protein